MQSFLKITGEEVVSSSLQVLRLALAIFCLVTSALAGADEPPFLSVVTTEADYALLANPDTSRPGSEMACKFAIPVRPDDPTLIPPVYLNVSVYPGHFEFLKTEFPEQFAGMTVPDYFALVGRRETRKYFTGGIYQFRGLDGELFYGFDFYMDYWDANEQLRAEEVLPLYTQMAETFSLRPLVYIPRTKTEIANVVSWGTPPFPVYFIGGEEPVAFESYTLAANYGRIRMMTMAELNAAQASGGLSWQDILILDAVPIDIEGVIAGVVTEERQSELSHLSIRTGRRGTPNAYLRNARELLALYDGQLVKLTVEENGWNIDAKVTLEQATAWWATHRPRLTNITVPDAGYAQMPSLLDMDVAETEVPLASRFGGKAAGLARMYSILPAEHQTPGFGIPFRYYREFMNSNTLVDTVSVPAVTRTYQEYIESLIANPRFQTDSVWRSARLAEFRDTIEDDGKIDPALVGLLATRIEAVFGSRGVMVRFRSSSNVEDALLFNGAGLYDSTSTCALDSFDGNNSGPSLCDPNQPKERSIERGLKAVWASLWNYRAYEEREYYQVPQANVAMAILVTTAYPDEASNGVAFTGDPTSGTSVGYVINVQIGDNSVVQPSVNVLPEKDILKLNAAGTVDRIVRSRASSMMAPGTWVLSDDQLRRLGATMRLVEVNLPLDTEGYRREDVLLDVEFKFTQADELIFKQVRPFLRDGAVAPIAGFSLR